MNVETVGSSNGTDRLLPWARACAVAGFLGVALGAFGAHGLKDLLAGRAGALDWWEKATFYHLVHSAGALVALCWTRRVLPTAFFLAGIALFSGSLYLMAFTGLRWLGAITPLGGILLLLGWLSLWPKSKN